MISLENLSKTYAKSGVKAVDSLALSVNSGEIFGFLGPNGAGKTTTIKLITGILKPDSGRILVDGIDLAADPIGAKKRLSYVPDTPDIFTRLKANEYLNFIGDVYEVSTEARREVISRYAERFKIDTVLDARLSSFSHGMKQKLILISSLLSDPPVWILDEPLVGLDPEAAYFLKEIMRERAKEGRTVFFSTHVMEVAEKLCDRIGVINEGKIVFTGTVEELRGSLTAPEGALRGDKESLESLFLELVDSDALKGENGQ